jgi:hypothetical protein
MSNVIEEPEPVEALVDCDDPASRLTLSRRRLDKAFRKAAIAAQRYSDVLWKIVEDNPPGFLNEADEGEG